MSSHSKYLSPSSAPQKMVCAWWENLEEAGQAAEKGTFLHKVFEESLKKGSHQFPKRLEHGATTEDLEGVFWAVDYVLENYEQFETEQKIEIGGGKTFGTADAVAENTVIDLKTGQIADYYEQIALYALGLMEKTGAESAEVVLLFSQFRSARSQIVTREEAENLWAELQNRVEMKETYPKTSFDGCKWCRNQLECQSKNALTSPQEATGGDFSKYGHLVKAVAEKRLEVLANEPQEAFSFYNSVKALAGWAEGVKKVVDSAILDGSLEIEGLEIQNRAGRAGVNALGVFNSLQCAGIDTAPFIGACSVSLTALANVIPDDAVQKLGDVSEFAKKNGELAKTKKQAALESVLSTHITRGEGASFVKVNPRRLKDA